MRVALLCDSPDEHWPSMDIVGEMLQANLQPPVEPERILRPVQRITPNLTLNRIWFRFLDYPAWVRRNRHRFDVFHIVDHSYSQLAHGLPPERTVITCHDIDTFRCLLQPDQDPRGVLFRAMTGRILSGFRKAAHVACDSIATLTDLERFGVVPPARLSVVPLGTHPACSPHPDAEADREAAELLAAPGESLDLLHVGSTIARKRIDSLLRIFAAVYRSRPAVRLLRVGGPFTIQQSALISELGIGSRVLVLPFVSRQTLAAIYRRAALVLLPSSAEGFGLPVAESLACGTPVLASSLPVLREVGGTAVEYRQPLDFPAWTSAVLALLTERELHPERWRARKQQGLLQAGAFSWQQYSNRMSSVYNNLL